MAAADLLIMPSYFESLSMVTLEAWAMGRPVLSNGKCDVLKGQSIRSNAGLYYETYAEFLETLHALEHNRWLSAALGRNGRQFFREHYDWPVIERKYLDMFERLSLEPPGKPMDPIPGWLERRRQNLPPAEQVLAGLPTGPSLADYRERRSKPDAGQPLSSPSLKERPAPAARLDNRDRSSGGGSRHSHHRRGYNRPSPERQSFPMIQIHQVLATLGYGDAIGHEVLGIQRVLRAQGYESEIFVETADYRLEPLTRDYRELVDFSHPDNLVLHHFSLGSKASRTAFALPDRMALIYHNITPPEYFIGVHRMLARQCFRGRRELRAYAGRCDLALGDSEFNRQDLEDLGFPRTAVLPVIPDFSNLDRQPNRHDGRSVRRRLDEYRLRRPGHREQEDRGSGPLFSRVPHDVQPAVPPAGRRRLQRLRAVPGVASTSWRRRSAPATCTFSATCPTKSSSPTTTSPTCSCARASTRDSACRSSKPSTSRSRSSRTRPRPFRTRWTAPASSTTTRTRGRWRR